MDEEPQQTLWIGFGVIAPILVQSVFNAAQKDLNERKWLMGI